MLGECALKRFARSISTKMQLSKTEKFCMYDEFWSLANGLKTNHKLSPKKINFGELISV
jgi:hypothetical protein